MKGKDNSCHCSHHERVQGGAEGQLHSYLTSVIDAGEWSVNFTPRPLYAWERTAVPTGLEAGWDPKTVWTL
jgi:hypothetical protein